METLINDTTVAFISSCNNIPDDLTNSGKLLLFCGDKFETPDIDTIYEVYISGHAFSQAFNRIGYRRIEYDEIVNYIIKILECTPIALLKTPQSNNRHIVFDIYNSNATDKNNIIQIACIIGAAKPTKLTNTLQKRYKSVMMCNIVIKTIIEISTPQFSKTDLINNAIHIPISINDSIDLDENEFVIKCDICLINKLISKQISASRILDKNNRGIKIYPYVEFFQVLEDLNIVNYPNQLDISSTLNKHSVVSAFENVKDMVLTNTLSVTDYKSLCNSIYRGGKYIDKYELSKKQKHQLIYNLISTIKRYNNPIDVVHDFISSKFKIQIV